MNATKSQYWLISSTTYLLLVWNESPLLFSLRLSILIITTVKIFSNSKGFDWNLLLSRLYSMFITFHATHNQQFSIQIIQSQLDGINHECSKVYIEGIHLHMTSSKLTIVDSFWNWSIKLYCAWTDITFNVLKARLFNSSWNFFRQDALPAFYRHDNIRVDLP